MNELQLIRGQLRTERERVCEVAAASAGNAATLPFRQACVDYLVFALARFEERDQILAERLHSRLTPPDPRRPQLDQALLLAGTSREALTRLEAALALSSQGSPAHETRGWSEFAAFVSGPWCGRRDAIDAVQEQAALVSDWRAASLVDADSILQERSLYARVQPGISGGLVGGSAPR